MGLDSNLISQFVKVTNDEKKPNTETTVYGTVVSVGDKTYVKLDGSDQLTPVSTTTNVKEEDRVSVLIKDHSAMVTGNMTAPSSSKKDDVDDDTGKDVTEFEIVIADKVVTEQLEGGVARIDTLNSDNVTVDKKLEAVAIEVDDIAAKDETVENIDVTIKATIENAEVSVLNADTANLTNVETEKVDAVNAEVENLKATYLEVDGKLVATKADIEDLDVEKLDADFSNFDAINVHIGKFDEFYAASGLIKEMTGEEITATRELIGVTIKGDLIEGGTIKADKLLLQGENGLYHKINILSGEVTSEELTEQDLQEALSGKAIIARTITADKIKVSDLAAFRATIGGFKITGDDDGKAGAIHTVQKESIENTTSGIYMDNDGQVAIGDKKNYIKYYKTGTDENGDDIWRLEVALESLILTLNDDGVDKTEDLVNLLDIVKVEQHNDKPSLVLYEVGSNELTRITSTDITVTDGVSDGTTISANGIEAETANIRGDFRQGGFVWKKRQNGTIHKLGLTWEGVDG